MPEVRKKGKKRIAVWLTPEQRSAIESFVKAGTFANMSDFVKRAIDFEKIKKGGMKK